MVKSAHLLPGVAISDAVRWAKKSCARSTGAVYKRVKQHVIPNCYLKAWYDPRTPENHTPYIWRMSRGGSSKKSRAPKKSFTATDRYTITLPTGEKDLTVENTLGGLENAFVSVRGESR
jgi:hypothetical protein